MIKKILPLFWVCSTAVFAEESSARLTVGINLVSDFQAYKGHNVEYSVLPTIFYDNDLVYAEGDEAGVYLINDDQNEFRLSAYYDGSSYRPSGSLAALDRRQWSVMAGASYMRITPFGGFKLQLARDVLNRNDGTVATMAYLAEYQNGPWSIYPELGLQWNDNKYNQYYFGVSAKESLQSGIETYKAKSSVQPYANLTVDYRLNKKWDVFTNFSFNSLSHEQYRSPMIKSHHELESTVGLNYKF